MQCRRRLQKLFYWLFVFKKFLGKIKHLLKKSGFENNIGLKHVVFGYKIYDNELSGFNYLITIIGFTIYKSYHLSERKTKDVNVYHIFMK